jgi:hypothetical protein
MTVRFAELKLSWFRNFNKFIFEDYIPLRLITTVLKFNL